jgi:flagellar L-ring protein precursor FlgH
LPACRWRKRPLPSALRAAPGSTAAGWLRSPPTTKPTRRAISSLCSSNTGGVSTDRSFKASSGVDSLPGRLKTGGIANLLGLHSAETLSGKGQASSTSTLRTSLTGRVVAVLPSGNLVIEAERSMAMNNEHQKIMVRGVVRPGDIGPDNTVVSNALSNLELEIKGKGVVSDGTRPPHPLLRMILRILNF